MDAFNIGDCQKLEELFLTSDYYWNRLMFRAITTISVQEERDT